MKPQRPQRKTLGPQREQIIGQRHRGWGIGCLLEDEIIFEEKAGEAMSRIYAAQGLIDGRRDREMNYLKDTEERKSRFL